jgi:hypothetical protein
MDKAGTTPQPPPGVLMGEGRRRDPGSTARPAPGTLMEQGRRRQPGTTPQPLRTPVLRRGWLPPPSCADGRDNATSVSGWAAAGIGAPTTRRTQDSGAEAR